MTQYKRFEPPKRLLLGPGPSPVDDRVLAAMSAPVFGHLDPLFLRCMDDVQALLRYVFETENRVTIPISATGSAGMEAALVNVIEPGDEVVVCINGVFGTRMRDIIERAKGRPVVVEAKWGEAIEPREIESALNSCRPRALALVHAETSTGVLQDLTGLAAMAHGRNALLIVDAVTSLAGHPVGVDRSCEMKRSNRRLIAVGSTFVTQARRNASAHRPVCRRSLSTNAPSIGFVRGVRRFRAGISISPWLRITGARIARIITRLPSR